MQRWRLHFYEFTSKLSLIAFKQTTACFIKYSNTKSLRGDKSRKMCVHVAYKNEHYNQLSVVDICIFQIIDFYSHTIYEMSDI